MTIKPNERVERRRRIVALLMAACLLAGPACSPSPGPSAAQAPPATYGFRTTVLHDGGMTVRLLELDHGGRHHVFLQSASIDGLALVKLGDCPTHGDAK